MRIARNERFVIDASIAVKWVVPETGSAEAECLLDREVSAPDLLWAECANILWKKVKRGELSSGEAEIAAQGLENAALALHSTRPYLAAALAIATALDHPAYDCVYLALAKSLKARLVTADARLVRAVERRGGLLRDCVVALSDLAGAASPAPSPPAAPPARRGRRRT